MARWRITLQNGQFDEVVADTWQTQGQGNFITFYDKADYEKDAVDGAKATFTASQVVSIIKQ